MKFKILVYSNKTWCTLHGHGCITEEQMRKYCSDADPSGEVLRVVEA